MTTQTSKDNKPAYDLPSLKFVALFFLACHLIGSFLMNIAFIADAPTVTASQMIQKIDKNTTEQSCQRCVEASARFEALKATEEWQKSFDRYSAVVKPQDTALFMLSPYPWNMVAPSEDYALKKMIIEKVVSPSDTFKEEDPTRGKVFMLLVFYFVAIAYFLSGDLIPFILFRITT